MFHLVPRQRDAIQQAPILKDAHGKERAFGARFARRPPLLAGMKKNSGINYLLARLYERGETKRGEQPAACVLARGRALSRGFTTPTSPTRQRGEASGSSLARRACEVVKARLSRKRPVAEEMQP